MIALKYIHITFEIWGSIFCLIAMLCVYITRRFDKREAGILMVTLISCALLNINEALAYVFRGNESKVGYVMVRGSNFMVFLFNYILLFEGIEYIEYLIQKRTKTISVKVRRFVRGVCALGIASLICSRIFGFYYAFDATNHYYRTDLFWIQEVLGIIGVLVIWIRMLQHMYIFEFLERVAWLLLAIMMIVTIIFQIFVYGISLISFAITLCIICMFIAYEIEYSQMLVEQERILNMEKVSLLRAQIQPHFMFNSLTVIKGLCRRNAEEAIEAIDEFSGFLRGIVDMLSEKDCILIERELDTVKNYLFMEQKRFGHQLKYIYDIQSTGFMLPPLTIQMLVENAVRHGIRKKLEGGTVIIKTYREDDRYIVEIKDDGVGFDVEHIYQDGKKHVGIQNVQNRLRLMCGGWLEIKSERNVGTDVRVVVPGRKREKYF